MLILAKPDQMVFCTFWKPLWYLVMPQLHCRESTGDPVRMLPICAIRMWVRIMENGNALEVDNLLNNEPTIINSRTKNNELEPIQIRTGWNQNGLTRTNTKGCTNQYDLMQISLRTDTNQYDLSRMQLGPVRTDTTWNGPVRTATTWSDSIGMSCWLQNVALTLVLSPVFFFHQINISFAQFWCCVILN